MRLTKKMADNGRCYLSGFAEVSNYYPKGYGRIQVGYEVEKLAEYEDLEEQGKLLKLPCAVGDTVYEINKIRETVSTFTVNGFSVSEHGVFVKWEFSDGIYRNFDGVNDDEIGKTVFLTRKEAEAALKKMDG